MRAGADLLPLFLDEARDRLERLETAVENLADDPDAAIPARRELHALKGASRMMGLRELAESCHRAEEMLADDSQVDVAAVVEQLDQISATIAAIGATSAPSFGAAPPAEGVDTGGADGPGETAVRISPEVLDRLADRGARLRIVSVGAKGIVNRIYHLASLADRGIGEPSPQQVLATLAASLRQVGLDLELGQRRLERLVDRQVDALLGLQVQPLRPFLLDLARHARELARSLDKRVEVEVDAGASQLDRRIIDKLRESFLHMVRNAVDHGIETPEVRASRGKTAVGRVRLVATPEGTRVRLLVEDDGEGIDPDTVRAAAVERGFLREDDARPAEEVLQLLTRPGFSTRDRVSEVSGRGVGLDAVAVAVRSVGGDIWVRSRTGSGTTVVLEVPVERRGERVLVVRAAGGTLALPSAPIRAFRNWIRGSDRSSADALQMPVRVLSEILGHSSDGRGVLVESVIEGIVQGLVVDEVVGEEEVFLRPLPADIGAPGAFDAMTLLASGRAVPVVSQRLLRQVVRDSDAPPPPSGRRPLRVLLVDDSPATREMLSRLLIDAGINVTSVGSGTEATVLLGDETYDCVVTDIEMPGMDGLALTRWVRSFPPIAHLPVIVVSTRSGFEDRTAGMRAGADAYLAKQGLDARDLITLVRRVGGVG